MATPTDSLSPPPAPSRVSYSLGRMLGAEDFQADQNYHRGSLARALLQLCGTGTVFGLNVQSLLPQVWQPACVYPAFAFVTDGSGNIQVNTGSAGTSGPSIAFATTPGAAAVADGSGIAWTNEGPLVSTGWQPNTTLTAPTAIMDPNGNLQILSATLPFTTGATQPVWNSGLGVATADGSTPLAAWTCAGPAQLEITVSAGLALDRVGRMIEVPQTVCIYLQPWMAGQTASDLLSALHGSAIMVDVFATFVSCSQGVTPSFATQDDYDATDAFAANRLLDSFAMQLILRTDAAPTLPQDAWAAVGAVPTAGVSATVVQTLKQAILAANTGAAASAPFAANGALPSEDPPLLDPSSVFLARISIPATAPSVAGQPPSYTLSGLTIDNLSRLFVYPPSLVARTMGLTSGTQSSTATT